MHLDTKKVSICTKNKPKLSTSLSVFGSLGSSMIGSAIVGTNSLVTGEETEERSIDILFGERVAPEKNSSQVRAGSGAGHSGYKSAWKPSA